MQMYVSESESLPPFPDAGFALLDGVPHLTAHFELLLIPSAMKIW